MPCYDCDVDYICRCDQDTVGLSNTVALDFGRALFGPIGGSVFACMVAISCFGALNGMSTLSRLLQRVPGETTSSPAH
jgi:hypothetical protein